MLWHGNNAKHAKHTKCTCRLMTCEFSKIKLDDHAVLLIQADVIQLDYPNMDAPKHDTTWHARWRDII